MDKARSGPDWALAETSNSLQIVLSIWDKGVRVQALETDSCLLKAVFTTCHFVPFWGSQRYRVEGLISRHQTRKNHAFQALKHNPHTRVSVGQAHGIPEWKCPYETHQIVQ